MIMIKSDEIRIIMNIMVIVIIIMILILAILMLRTKNNKGIALYIRFKSECKTAYSAVEGFYY